MNTMPPGSNHHHTQTRWTSDDVLAVQWVVMRYLAMTPAPADTIQRRLHWADHMLPCLQNPSMKGFGFAEIPDAGPLVALCSFVANCQRRADDHEWCRAVLNEAQVNLSDLLSDIRPFAHLYVFPHDVPVQQFQPCPDHYALVPLDELPYGHTMHSCDHKDRFETTLNTIKLRAKILRLGLSTGNDTHAQTKAGRRLAKAITRGKVAPCQLHPPGLDWDHLNTLAQQIRTTVTPWTETSVVEAVQQLPDLNDIERLTLTHLFTDPIRWDLGFPQVAGGQHRICGYRTAGATHAFVATGRPKPSATSL